MWRNYIYYKYEGYLFEPLEVCFIWYLYNCCFIALYYLVGRQLDGVFGDYTWSMEQTADSLMTISRKRYQRDSLPEFLKKKIFFRTDRDHDRSYCYIATALWVSTIYWLWRYFILVGEIFLNQQSEHVYHLETTTQQ